MPMELLNVEITETALVTNENVLKDEITSLRKHGVKVSLDDFGTGLSNLNRLRTRQMPSKLTVHLPLP